MAEVLNELRLLFAGPFPFVLMIIFGLLFASQSISQKDRSQDEFSKNSSVGRTWWDEWGWVF